MGGRTRQGERDMPARRGRPPGSKTLAAELRRLRGDRTLGDVSALSRESPLGRLFRPLAQSTLCVIEGGETTPSVDTLSTLASIYRVPLTTLAVLASGDAAAATDAIPAGATDLAERHDALAGAGRWHAARSVAARALGEDPDGPAHIDWLARRARAAREARLWEDATWTLLALLEESSLPAARRVEHLLDLAVTFDDAGLPLAGLARAREARLALTDEVPAPLAARAHRTLARLVVACVDDGSPRDEHAAHEGLRSVRLARSLVRPGPAAREALELDLLETRLRDALGNHLLAAGEYLRLARAARTAGWVEPAAMALLALGRLRRSQGRPAEASAHFEDAYRQCIDAHAHDAALDASVELLGMSSTGAGRGLLLKRCQRIQPLASRGGRAHRELRRQA
jgi:tetratricopeptide (TPR) repeat protein